MSYDQGYKNSGSILLISTVSHLNQEYWYFTDKTPGTQWHCICARATFILNKTYICVWVGFQQVNTSQDNDLDSS